MNSPEKIYGWMDTQLSIARFYGGINFNGHSYVIDESDPQRPLVRQDLKTKKKKRTTKEEAQKNFEAMLNGELPL
jgi:hypothetical protein